MRALSSSKSKKGRRFYRKKDFPRHPLKNYICSIELNTCEPVDNVISKFEFSFQKEYADYAGSSIEPSKRILLALERVFHEAYESGYIWYPRDRWRTSWQITMMAAKRAIGSRINAYKKQLYNLVKYMRNPSSNHDALK